MRIVISSTVLGGKRQPRKKGVIHPLIQRCTAKICALRNPTPVFPLPVEGRNAKSRHLSRHEGSQAKDPGPGVPTTCPNQVPHGARARSLSAGSSEGKEVSTYPSLPPRSVTQQSSGERGGKERMEEKSMQRPVGK